MFTNTIELNKDSSVVKTFRGDLMNNNSFGTWKMRHDTLILKFDSVKHPTNRYLGDEYYIVKRKKLFQTITETQLKMLRKQFSFSDSLSPPTQEKFQEMIRQQQTMIDFKGTMRENYYVKID